MKAVHGWILGWSESLDRKRRSEGLRVDMIHRSVHQKIIEVTYLSDRIVSVVETGRSHTDSNPNGTGDPYAHGVTIDLPTRQTFAVGPCPGRGRPFFRIGPYFDFCTIERYDAFLDLWIRKGIALSQARPPIRRYEADKDCDRIDYEDVAPGMSFTVYLTLAGLAVHAGSLVRFKGDECGDERNSFNPVILPYRELEPFLQPGPWKDELLK